MNGVIGLFQELFGPVITVLGTVLLFFHQNLGVEWWLSIAMLTAVVRTLLFPLTVKQVRNMRSMQDLKPEMDRVRAKYQSNREKQQEELMKLYRERGVNPLGGCLPILVQMPIFIGIFYLIRRFGGVPGQQEPLYDSFRDGGILWFQDLSHRDPTLLLPIISAVTMLAATEITSKNAEPQQRWLMRLLPVVVTVFLWKFPAGLFVYWITSNLVTFVQNYVIYNYGPGRKPGKKAESRETLPGIDKGERVETQNADDRIAEQARKSAKRKRRKKKK